MRPIQHALIGALALFALLSATACSKNGIKPDSYQPIKTETVEVQVRQLVPIEATLTDVAATRLPPAPIPAVPFGPTCARKAGCFSNAQADWMRAQALDGYGKRGDNLGAVRRAGEEATKGTKPP